MSIKNTDNLLYDKLSYEMNELQKIIWEKEERLYDRKLSASLRFKKLCYHLYYYDESTILNAKFCTNFLELVGGVCVKPSSNGIELSQPEYCTSLSDIFVYSDEYVYFQYNNLSRFVK